MYELDVIGSMASGALGPSTEASGRSLDRDVEDGVDGGGSIVASTGFFFPPPESSSDSSCSVLAVVARGAFSGSGAKLPTWAGLRRGVNGRMLLAAPASVRAADTAAVVAEGCPGGACHG